MEEILQDEISRGMIGCKIMQQDPDIIQEIHGSFHRHRHESILPESIGTTIHVITLTENPLLHVKDLLLHHEAITELQLNVTTETMHIVELLPIVNLQFIQERTTLARIIPAIPPIPVNMEMILDQENTHDHEIIATIRIQQLEKTGNHSLEIQENPS